MLLGYPVPGEDRRGTRNRVRTAAQIVRRFAPRFRSCLLELSQLRERGLQFQ